ncbi:MAG: ribosome-associated translation inhibitor RaiA [Pseudohongiella sp.]|nr:ribosome-associated translation inhibitor RaiA [Pseudohongiella sp.]
MEIPIQITLRDVDHSEALETHIREKSKKLENFFDHIISCRVVVEKPHKHKHQGGAFNIRIDIGVPGREIVVNRDRHEDVYVALRDAFDAAKRQLEDYTQRLRGETKLHQPEYIGQVVRLFAEDGCGFIQRADGDELYFHRDNVVSPTFDQLKVGDEVKFVEEMAAEGTQAKRVSLGRHHLPQ